MGASDASAHLQRTCGRAIHGASAVPPRRTDAFARASAPARPGSVEGIGEYLKF